MKVGAGRVFRQSALDRLSSPEELDRLITLSRPRDWIAAAAVAALIAGAAAWSVVGSVSTRVKGSGILITRGGHVADAASVGDGVLASFAVAVGAHVAQGDVVARIEARDLRQALADARAAGAEKEAHYAALQSQIAENQKALAASLAARKQLLEVRARDAEQRAEALDAGMASQIDMYQHHWITVDRLNDARQALAVARQAALEARSQISEAASQAISASNSDDRELRASLDRVAEGRRQVADLDRQIAQREEILSPVDGRVTELKVAPGARVSAGLPLVSVESGASGLELVVYFPPDQGKQVKAGMEARVSPSNVRKEDFGTLVGSVADVSDFPATAQSMLATLQNERLVQSLSPAGAPFAARLKLDGDSANPSGYRWSSGRGPNATLSSGTLADAEVTVEERTPASLIVPWLKKATGLAN